MSIWQRPDILTEYSAGINLEGLQGLRTERHKPLKRPYWQDLRRILAQLPLGTEISARRGSLEIDVSADAVKIGEREDLSSTEYELLTGAVQRLIPWRKGPFSLFGLEIDAEWRSDFKWNRISPYLGNLKGARVADIGCSNGYYMFRASSYTPECIVGIDPSEAFYYSFELFQRFIQNPRLQYELFGVEHIGLFSEFFDVALCLGVIYHQRNPLQMLHDIKQSLASGGSIILESQAIAGEQPVSLFPEGRYAKARNVYFVPTAACLVSCLKRAGFIDVEICSQVKVSSEEQRRTDFAPYESLQDFLDPNDSDRTIEGYPAPWRVVVKAKKP